MNSAHGASILPSLSVAGIPNKTAPDSGPSSGSTSRSKSSDQSVVNCFAASAPKKSEENMRQPAAKSKLISRYAMLDRGNNTAGAFNAAGLNVNSFCQPVAPNDKSNELSHPAFEILNAPRSTSLGIFALRAVDLISTSGSLK